jgi:hypothetical protein
MVFKNIRVLFLGSGDFPKDAEMLAAQDLNCAIKVGWSGVEIGEPDPALGHRPR